MRHHAPLSLISHEPFSRELLKNNGFSSDVKIKITARTQVRTEDQ